MKIGKLKIKKGFFYGAGSPKIYNWSKDNFHIYGVGIKKDLLSQFDILEIEINNQFYQLDTHAALLFAEKYNSYKVARGTTLAVVSKSLLCPV